MKHSARWYKKFTKKHPNLHVVLVATAVVLFWRGVWGIADMYLFPSNSLISFITSIVIALVILLIGDYRLNELK